MLSPPAPTPGTVLLAVLALAALIAIARSSRKWTVARTRPTAWLESSWAPIAAGIVTATIVRLVWGSFSEPGVMHDERAYLLQAGIFAHGSWTAPAPAIPAFFEQMHVFVEPAVFAKYPPGHSLTLALGVWLGLPGLMPSFMTGLSGALVFWIARRLGNGWIAFFTWWLWTTAWANLLWATSYFSETSSAAMWWVAVWATIRWLDTGRTRFLIGVAAALAWGFETRPLTMAALALPLAFVIMKRLRDVESVGRVLAGPVVVAVAILILGPVWNQQTLGDWRLNPYSYYSKVYVPFDKPGFGVDSSPPLRALPPELAAFGTWSRDVHEEHMLSRLPATFAQRVAAILLWCADGWRLTVAALILAAILHGSGIERLGLATVGTLLLAYLSFAHAPGWMLYYAEVLPILYFLAACQMGRLLHKFSSMGRDAGARWAAPVTNGAVAAALLLIGLGVTDVFRVRSAVNARNAFHRTARLVIDANIPPKAIVLVHYPPGHNPHLSLTGSEPDPWLGGRRMVPDRGPRNWELLALNPGVPAFRLDARTFQVDPVLDSHRAGAFQQTDVDAGDTRRVVRVPDAQ